MSDGYDLVPLGAQVTLNRDTDFTGIITGITIRENAVQYEVTWWDDRVRNTAWMYEFEFNHATTKTRVGLRANQ